MTTPIEATGATSVSAALAATAATQKKDPYGKDTFLKLLVAQMSYQDPMNPQDGAEFLSQTAQFSVVEKLNEMAKLETELLAAQRLLGGSSLVGKTVTFPGADGTNVSGVVTAARTGPDGVVLRVGDHDVPISQVQEVRNSPA